MKKHKQDDPLYECVHWQFPTSPRTWLRMTWYGTKPAAEDIDRLMEYLQVFRQGAFTDTTEDEREASG